MADMIMLKAEEKMEGTVENLKREMSKVRTGRANPNILDSVRVDYYGSPSPIAQIAGVSVPEAQQLLIKPFDKSILGGIEKAISAANLGVNPNNDGETIRIVFPALTEERRKELVKQVKAMGETNKVAIRNARREAMDSLKKSDLPEDEIKGHETEVQNLTDKFNKIIEETVSGKETELLKV